MREDVVKVAKPVNYLLVEGRDDEHVFYSLLEHHKIPERFKIKNKQGIDKLLDTLEVELDQSGLERLGIVVDTDNDQASRWQSLRSILISLGYDAVPVHPILNGTIIKQNKRPTVGIWLMPDNNVPGMIEDFISFLVPLSDILWPLADEILEQVIQRDCRFPQSHRIKAQLHTWLAWQKEPGIPLGLSITKRYLDADAPHAIELISWLRRLFKLDSA